MIEIKYVSSNGEEYNLIGDRMRATSGYFHSYEWKASVTENTFGATVNEFIPHAPSSPPSKIFDFTESLIQAFPLLWEPGSSV